MDLLLQVVQELKEFRKEVSAEFKAVRGELKGEIAELRAEVAGTKGEMGELRAEVANLRLDMNRGFDAVNDRLDGILLNTGEHHRKLDQRVTRLEEKVFP